MLRLAAALAILSALVRHPLGGGPSCELAATSRRHSRLWSVKVADQVRVTPYHLHGPHAPSLLDADTCCLYWADGEANRTRFIGQYRLDDGAESVLAELRRGTRVVGLAADTRRNAVYYADASDNSIKAVRTDNRNVSTVIRGLGPGLCCLAASKRNGDLFWKETIYQEGSARDLLYKLASGSTEKTRVYAELKPLTMRALTTEPTGRYVIWCSSDTSGKQALLKYDLAGGGLKKLTQSNFDGDCLSLAADGTYIYILTSLQNGSSTLYATTIDDTSSPPVLLFPPGAWSDLTAITLVDAVLSSPGQSDVTVPPPSEGTEESKATDQHYLVLGLSVGLTAATLIASGSIGAACYVRKRNRSGQRCPRLRRRAANRKKAAGPYSRTHELPVTRRYVEEVYSLLDSTATGNPSPETAAVRIVTTPGDRRMPSAINCPTGDSRSENDTGASYSGATAEQPDATSSTYRDFERPERPHACHYDECHPTYVNRDGAYTDVPMLEDALAVYTCHQQPSGPGSVMVPGSRLLAGPSHDDLCN